MVKGNALKNAACVLVVAAAIAGNVALRRAAAKTNINATTTEHFAWNDLVGWLDFYGSDTVWLSGTRLQGYATSPQIGEISLDCATSPAGNICAQSNYGICNGAIATHNPDGTCSKARADGNLRGYAWNDAVGWIAFNCADTASGCPGAGWGVTVDINTGVFRGWAWSDVAGWIGFNCANTSACASGDYRVASGWTATSTVAILDSAVIDTQVMGGATLNSITWKGDRYLHDNSDLGDYGGFTYVDFQIAASENADGPWTFAGPGGGAGDYYSLPCSENWRGGVDWEGHAKADTPICVDPGQVKNKRYLRYRVRMRSNLLQNNTPVIDDIVLNWAK